jgi:hypothetical protein
MYEADGTPIRGVPKNKDMKLHLAKFSARETHKDLGTGVNEWVTRSRGNSSELKLQAAVVGPKTLKLTYWKTTSRGRLWTTGKSKAIRGQV